MNICRVGFSLVVILLFGCKEVEPKFEIEERRWQALVAQVEQLSVENEYLTAQLFRQNLLNNNIKKIKSTIVSKSIDEESYKPVLSYELQLSSVDFNAAYYVEVILELYQQEEVIMSESIHLRLTSEKQLLNGNVDLPNFGMDAEQLNIRVQPVAWYPSYKISLTQ